jgi:hypothetical protein
VFTKGYGLIEALLALLLTSLMLTAALNCQWFARRAMQVALEQMTATHLLIDISHSVNFSTLLAAQPIIINAQPCATCPAVTSQQGRVVQQLLQQPLAAVLVDPELCIDVGAKGVRYVLSWQSNVPPSASASQVCRSGVGRRQIVLDGTP